MNDIDPALQQRLRTKSRQANFRFLSRAKAFLKKIGLPTEEHPSYVPDPVDCFFPGVWLDKGILHYVPARARVCHVLHDAGHLALTPKDQWQLLAPGALQHEVPLGPFKWTGDAAVEAWDWAAGKAAGINSLAVIGLNETDFNGKALETWETFDYRLHPGFSLLRFLKMSSAWGTCDRWFIGDASVPETDQGLTDCFKTCTEIERRMLLKAMEALIRSSDS